jgi:hypothetical protein
MNATDFRKGTTMAKTTNLLWSCALVVALGCGAWADQTQTRIWSGDLTIPNGGQVVQDLEFPGLPAGARVTQVDYEVTVDDWNNPDNFWCSDYEIYIGNVTHGPFYSRIWDNQGGKTDKGQDSDPEDDSDVELKGSLPTQFDGDPAGQKWYVGVRDTVTSHGSALQGLGRLTYVRLAIHYVVPKPDLQDAGEAYRVVSPTPVTPGDTITVSCKVQNAGDLAAGGFSVSFYVSPDTTITTADSLLGTKLVSGLDAGQSVDVSCSGAFTLSSPATCYLGWIIDPANLVVESNEGNNTAYKQITVVEKITVPNVVGMTQSQATSTITSAGLSVGAIGQSYSDTVPAGRVISQNPIAGVRTGVNSAVALTVSQGPEGSEMVTVPDVVGMTQSQATSTITSARLVVGTINYSHSETVPEGRVISQDPTVGIPAAVNSVVELTVSSGPAPVNPVAHWRLDEAQGTTAFDSVGDYDGILRGNPVWLPDDGVIEGALWFDGVDDAVSIPKVGESVEFTYSLWLNQAVVSPEDIGIIAPEDLVPGSVRFELRDGHLKVGIKGIIQPNDIELEAVTSIMGPNYIPALGNWIPTAGDWHHVAVTKSATSLDLYADGELVAHRDLVRSDAVILGDGFLGAWQDAQSRLSRGFYGALDDVRIYTRALSAGQINRAMTGSDEILLTEARDIGTAVPGSDSYAGGVYTVTADGKDIWDTSDEFRYVYRRVTGDFEISACVHVMGHANSWEPFAGLMVRQTLEPESRHASMLVTPEEGEGRFAFRCRPVPAGATNSLHSTRGQVSDPTNTWVKIKRQGNSFTAFTSQDGAAWTTFAGPEVDAQGYPSVANPVTIDMPETVYMGLAVTSHSAGQLSTAEFDRILIALHAAEGPEGLLAHWAFDETSGRIAADSAGGQDAVLMGNPAWQPAGGTVGGALRFNGLSDYCQVAVDYFTPNRSIDSFFTPNPPWESFSIFAWVKGGAPGQVIVSQADGAAWLAAGTGGALKTQLSTGGTPSLTSSAVITDGQWHRIGLVSDGSVRFLYVDDIEVARDTQSNLAGATGGGGSGLYIGAGGTLSPGSFWSGLIDDVRIYNRAVTP